MQASETGFDRAWRPAAPLGRRVLAGIYTGSRVLLMLVPLRLAVFGILLAGHPPHAIRTFDEMAAFRSSLEFWTGIYGLVAAGLLFYAFLLRPVREGATWGQERFGIAVEDLAGDFPGWRPVVIRALVHLGWLIVSPVGLFYLVWCLVKGEEPVDLTDLWSGTRQFDEQEEPLPLRLAIGKAFFPAALALLLQIGAIMPMGIWMMAQYRNRDLVDRIVPAPTPAKLNAEKVQKVLKAQQDAMNQ